MMNVITRQYVLERLPDLPYGYVWELRKGLTKTFRLCLMKRRGFWRKPAEIDFDASDSLTELLRRAPFMIKDPSPFTASAAEDIYGQYDTSPEEDCDY